MKIIFGCVAVLLFLCSCAIPRPDYTAFQRHLPKSILVLPPLNTTAELKASNQFLSTISLPVAESGYYIFPISLVDRILRENGVVSPIEMRQVSAKKLHDIFGADALLDISIEHWGTEYLIIGSSTTVTMSYRLVDLKTGTELWRGSGTASDNSKNSNNGIAGALVEALVHAAVNTIAGPEIDLARQANSTALMNEYNGLLRGPRAPLQNENIHR